MEIPIYIDGEQAGTLTLTREGPRWLADARLRDVGRVVRLRVFGPRGEGYLGVPVPEEGQLRLTRRLTPAQLRGFPPEPRYAAEHRLAREEGPVQGEEAPGHVLWLGGRPHYF